MKPLNLEGEEFKQEAFHMRVIEFTLFKNSIVKGKVFTVLQVISFWGKQTEGKKAEFSNSLT